MPLTVFAYLPPGQNPPSINFVRMEDHTYKFVVCLEGGGTVEMTIPREMVAEMYRSMLRDLMVTEKASL